MFLKIQQIQLTYQSIITGMFQSSLLINAYNKKAIIPGKYHSSNNRRRRKRRRKYLEMDDFDLLSVCVGLPIFPVGLTSYVELVAPFLYLTTVS